MRARFCTAARRRHPLEPPPPPESFPPLATPAETVRFEVLHESRFPGSRARAGRLHTPHGAVDTPGFVPVGTNAALKAVCHVDADAVGMQLMFVNTYHMILQPGPDAVAAAGGLHAFMGRRARPLITDSGGFQIFSLRYGGVAEELAAGGGSLKRAPRGDGGDMEAPQRRNAAAGVVKCGCVARRGAAAR